MRGRCIFMRLVPSAPFSFIDKTRMVDHLRPTTVVCKNIIKITYLALQENFIPLFLFIIVTSMYVVSFPSLLPAFQCLTLSLSFQPQTLNAGSKPGNETNFYVCFHFSV